MDKKRKRVKVQEDEKKLRQFETTLSDLPNEMLIRIMKEHSADDFLELLQTSQALMERLAVINDDMFRYFLKRDFDLPVPPTFDARTAYLMRRHAEKKYQMSYELHYRDDQVDGGSVSLLKMPEKHVLAGAEFILADLDLHITHLFENIPKCGYMLEVLKQLVFQPFLSPKHYVEQILDEGDELIDTYESMGFVPSRSNEYISMEAKVSVLRQRLVNTVWLIANPYKYG